MHEIPRNLKYSDHASLEVNGEIHVIMIKMPSVHVNYRKCNDFSMIKDSCQKTDGTWKQPPMKATTRDDRKRDSCQIA